MTELRTEIEIGGAAENVWAVLMDFERYGDWNPFVQTIAGTAVVGERLEVRLTPPGGRGMTVRPVVRACEPDREFRWLGHVGLPGLTLVDGEHYFLIEPAGPGRVRFVHGERFSGVLAGLIVRMVGRQTREGFEQMNAALRQRVEAMQSALTAARTETASA